MQTYIKHSTMPPRIPLSCSYTRFTTSGFSLLFLFLYLTVKIAHFHKQRREDFRDMMKAYLSAQIEFHEKARNCDRVVDGCQCR